MSLSYLQWNDLLANYYFNEDNAGQDVIIYANAELINKIGEKNNADFLDFKQKVIEGPDWVKEYHGFCHKAYYTYFNWKKNKKLSIPPYFAYLVFFVHVATVSGEFDTNAYYPRLRFELGEEPMSGSYPYFHRMDELWADLQKWTEEDKIESLGRFTLRRRFEAWKHVGIPLSQILLSDEERQKLPLFFYEAGLDPSDLPSDATILQQLKIFGPSLFKKRTVDMVQSQKKEHKEFQNSLIDLVLSVLAEWDRTCEEDIEGSSTGKKEAPSNLILGFKIDKISESVVFNTRIKSKKEFPDAPLRFKIGNTFLTCGSEGSPNWSTSLKTEGDVTFNPVGLDWMKGEKIFNKSENWPLNFKGSTLRVFLPGRYESLSGWIEVQRVKPKNEYFILCHDSINDEINRWGKKSNNEFQEKNFNGIPPEWNMYYARDLKLSHAKFGVLSLPSQSRIFLDGGLRIGKSNHFLVIAPPTIILDSKTGEDNIFINEITIPLKPTVDDPAKFNLPDHLPLNVPIVIKLVSEEGIILQKRTIFLERFNKPQISQEWISRDNSGEIVSMELLQSQGNSQIQFTVLSGCTIISSQSESFQEHINAMTRK